MFHHVFLETKIIVSFNNYKYKIQTPTKNSVALRIDDYNYIIQNNFSHPTLCIIEY